MSAPPMKAPKHLSAAARAWWTTVAADYALEAHHLHLLTLAAEAWDRAEEARKTLAESGATFLNRFGEPRPHPSVAIERDSAIRFARLVRELGLDGAAPEPYTRLPRPGR